jgi:hypothetical protein
MQLPRAIPVMRANFPGVMPARERGYAAALQATRRPCLSKQGMIMKMPRTRPVLADPYRCATLLPAAGDGLGKSDQAAIGRGTIPRSSIGRASGC